MDVKKETMVLPNQSTQEVYAFPIYQTMKDRNGNDVDVVVQTKRLTREQLLKQKETIDSMVAAADDLETSLKAGELPIEEPKP